MSKAAKLGLFGILIPHDLGGAGADFRTLIIATEELSVSSASMASLIAFHNIVCAALTASGNAKSMRSLLSRIASFSLASLCLDPIQKITYKETSNGFVLNGSIDYTVGGFSADVFLVPAKHADANKNMVFAFSRDQILKMEEFVIQSVQHLGLKASDSARIELKNLELTSETVLSDETETPVGLDRILFETRLAVAAQALGISRASIYALSDYARKKSASKIYTQGSTEDFLTRAKANLEKARSVCYRSAGNLRSDAGIQRDSAIARVSASSEALRDATELIRVSGGQIPNADQFLRDATATHGLVEYDSYLRQLAANSAGKTI